MEPQSNSALDALDQLGAQIEAFGATLERTWARDQQAARDRAAERRQAR